MPVVDLLNWPMPEGAEPDRESSETPDPATTVLALRAELAEAQRELRRLRTRVADLEEENERLGGPSTTREPTQGGAVEIFVDDEVSAEAEEEPLPLAVTRREK